MRFNSLIYLAFLAVVVLVFWAVRPSIRKWWLLGVSWLFYASWHWPFLGLLVGIGTLNHFGAIWIRKHKDRHIPGAVIIAANVLVLGLFKYADWLLANTNSVLHLLGVGTEIPLLRWILPLGLSFYVFEGISYTVDVVRKREEPKEFWDFQLYMAYFPHLVAGPIMRAKELIPQFGCRRILEPAMIRDGLWKLGTGLFVKIVLADGLAPQVDAAFARQANSLGSLDVWLMAVGFGLQIYLDFSSYSRIAIGSSKLCGLELVENFDFPYGARNPVEFWAKWHMSLSRWIRDYLFYPLVGKKATLGALVRAAIVSMVLCGIWHGAGWTFVLWGGYHGLLIAAYHLIAGWRKRRGGAARVGESVLGGVLATLGTFSVVSLGWLLFRSTNLGQAVALIGRAMSPWAHPERALPGTLYLFVGCTLALVWLAPGLQRMARSAWQRAEATPRGVLAWHIGAGAVLGLSAVFGLMYLRGQTSFIYFQF